MIHTLKRLTVLSFLLAHLSYADQVSEVLASLPEPAGSLLADNAITLLQPSGQDRDLLRTRIVDVRGMGFRKALEIETTGTAKYYTDARVAVKTDAPLRKGDVVFLSLYMKCPENSNDIGKGIIGASMGSYEGGYTFRT